jgi:hypothetical protein
MMARLKDKLWLWGQDAGSHHAAGNNQWNIPGENKMNPADGAEFFGIKNCCRVVMSGSPEPPFDEESRELQAMDQVVWSILGDCDSRRNDAGGEDLAEVLRQAGMYPNITGAVLDDFFGSTGEGRISIERLKEIKYELKHSVSRPLDLWLVYYEVHLGRPHQEYLDLCDVITFWTWNGRNLYELDANFEKVMKMTPGKKRLAGCYMWNYGEQKPMTIEQMDYQCSKYYQWLKQGCIDGIILCSNCIADVGLDTVEWTKDWIECVGMDEV